MESRIAQLNKKASRRFRAQAALWVTELHGPGRNTALDARVRRWIAQDPRHAAAFELATEAWQRSGNLPWCIPQAASPLMQSRKRLRAYGRTAAGMAILCISFICAVYFLRDETLATGPGEQRSVELNDGTQVLLNANSHVVVQYDDRVRKVRLVSGEALFNVVKHQPRPFIVVVGDRKVIAMGTSFMVRREEPQGAAFAVTLVEGRVAIEPVSWPDVLPSRSAAGLKLLSPGQRLRFTGEALEEVDSPSIKKVTAWQRGQLIFDDTSLSEAAAEFNRYSSDRITIDGPALGRLRVGGVFRIGDPTSFVHAIANAYHLQIVNRSNVIALSDKKIDTR